MTRAESASACDFALASSGSAPAPDRCVLPDTVSPVSPLGRGRATFTPRSAIDMPRDTGVPEAARSGKRLAADRAADAAPALDRGHLQQLSVLGDCAARDLEA